MGAVIEMDDERLGEMFRTAAASVQPPPSGFDHADVLARSRRLARRQRTLVTAAVLVVVAGLGTGVVIGAGPALTGPTSTLASPDAGPPEAGSPDAGSMAAGSSAEQRESDGAAGSGNAAAGDASARGGAVADEERGGAAPGGAADPDAAGSGAAGSGPAGSGPAGSGAAGSGAAAKSRGPAHVPAPDAPPPAAPGVAPAPFAAPPGAPAQESGPTVRGRAGFVAGCAVPDAEVFAQLTSVLPELRDRSARPVPGGCAEGGVGVAVTVHGGTLAAVVTPAGVPDPYPGDSATRRSAVTEARSGRVLRLTSTAPSANPPYRDRLRELAGRLAAHL